MRASSNSQILRVLLRLVLCVFFSSSVVGAIAVAVVVVCLLAIAVFFSPIIIINDFNYFIARSFGAWVLPIC